MGKLKKQWSISNFVKMRKPEFLSGQIIYFSENCICCSRAECAINTKWCEDALCFGKNFLHHWGAKQASSWAVSVCQRSTVGKCRPEIFLSKCRTRSNSWPNYKKLKAKTLSKIKEIFNMQLATVLVS